METVSAIFFILVMPSGETLTKPPLQVESCADFADRMKAEEELVLTLPKVNTGKVYGWCETVDIPKG